MFRDRLDTRPASLWRLALACVLVHDLVLVPVVLLIGLAAARWLPRRARPLVQAGLVLNGVVALYAFPLVRGYGRAAHNPTSLPHDYAHNLVVVVAFSWLAIGMVSLSASRVRKGLRGRPAARARAPAS